MKIHELIELLQQNDPEDDVVVVNEDGLLFDITDVEQDGPFVMIEID